MGDSIKNEPYSDGTRPDGPGEGFDGLGPQIVSANYRDRHSPQKWLTRAVDSDPERDFKQVSALTASNATFTRSGQYEQGFGCGIIAKCENAVILDVSPPLDGSEYSRILFKRDWPNGDEFYPEASVGVSHCAISKAGTLVLLSDGTMYAKDIQYGGASY